MKQHILLEQAHRYPSQTAVNSLKGCSFQQEKGYWVNNSAGQAMMESDDPKPPTTKKCDRETGEDQKGE